MADLKCPFQLTVYSSEMRRRGWIGAPLKVDAHPRHNSAGYVVVDVDADHPRVPDLVAAGARMRIDYDGQFLMSGRVGRITGKGPAAQATVSVTVEDDFRLLQRLLGWPNPTGSIAQQGAATAYDTKTGPAETVLKWFVSRNAGRSRPPVQVAADAGRGAAITVSMRMHPLADRLFPAVDQAGIGVQVRQEGAVLVVDCYQPVHRRQLLTERSGIVVDWAWSSSAPTATDVIVAGAGEGTAREFLAVSDPTRRDQWGESVEVSRDARDVGGEPAEGEPAVDPVPVLTERGRETLTDGAPTTGITLTLAESKGWRYGKSVRVGDLVTTQIAPGTAITDVLREASIQWTRDGGLEVTPIVGERTDDPSVTLRQTINAITRSIRDLRVGR